MLGGKAQCLNCGQAKRFREENIWEGINLKKISKKIVSLVTLAAFALTLVPAAAFAAPEDKTGYTVKEANYNKATVNITLSDEDVADLNATENAGNVLVWAEDSDGIVDMSAEGVEYSEGTEWAQNDIDVLSPASNKMSVDLTFAKDGDYKIYVALNKGPDFVSKVEDAKKIATEAGSFATKFADLDYSGYGVVNAGVVQEETTVEMGDTLDTTFVVNYDFNKGTEAPLNNVWIWAEDKDGDVADVVSFDGEKGKKSFDEVTNGAPKVKVTFNKDGDYTLRAGVAPASENTLDKAKENPLADSTLVKVSAEPVVIDEFADVEATLTIDDVESAPIDVETKDDTLGVLDLTGTEFAYDGVDTITLTGVAKDEKGNTIQGKTITATTNKNTAVEFDDADKENVATTVTDNFGRFSISFVMPNQENATVTFTNEEDNISYTVQIYAVKSTAENIDRTLTGGYVLAGNDSKYGTEVYAKASKTAPVSFADAVQFEITDQKGEALTGPAAAADAKIDVRHVGKNSTLRNDDLALIWDANNGVYTLGYTGAATADGNYAKDLVPGKYEVRVALPSNDNATVTFNVDKFGKVQDTVLAITASDYDQSPANPNEEVLTVDDTITLGQRVTVNAKYVDENGLKVAANDVSFNFNGKAVSDWKNDNNSFATEPDIRANDSLIGTTVKVIAFNTANKQLVEKTLTVADSYTDKNLEFSDDNGAVSKDNKVTVSVVNEEGKVQQVEGDMTAWVADQSNEDAKVSVEVNKNGVHDVQNGKGSLTVYADQETTADITVVVKAGTEAYYGTLEYTFGSEDALANRTVVMTINSTEYVVNNNIITGDAAPYIDENWRTMVPIRALMEAFDAEVVWDESDPDVVTINYDGDTQIVMNVGETAYTVDGEEGNMDTVPVNKDGRVYVPIRFVAEGIGFNVTPLYDDNNLTASVVFQR